MTAFAESFQKWFNAGLGFFYPEVCRLCEAEPATVRDGFVGARNGPARWPGIPG